MSQPNRRINRNSNQFRGINSILGSPRAGPQPPAPASGSGVRGNARSAPRPDLGVCPGTARVDKENRLHRGRDTGGTNPRTNPRNNPRNTPSTDPRTDPRNNPPTVPPINPVNHGPALQERVHQMPVNSAKRKRGEGEVETEPVKKRPANEATATTIAANPTASTITAATTAVATPTAATPAAITPLATAVTPATITPAAPTTTTTGRPKVKINVEMLKKKTEELRRKNAEAANNRNNVGGAATSAPVTPQADNTKSDLQKKIDEKRKTYKQKMAAIKSRTATATATPTATPTVQQQQQALPSPPSSNAASPDASPCTDSQRDFTQELKQAKLKRVSTTDVSMPVTKSAMQVAPLPSSDMMSSTLPNFKTSPIPSIEESNITFNMIRTDDVEQYEHTFDVFDYADSVPILFSADIAHDDGIWDVYTSNEGLMAMAIDLIIKGKAALQDGLPWKGLPLGRKNGTDSSLPTKVITDVDLYLRLADNKVYVASEQGLILAASYLTLIGVPPTQKVKWNGRIPMWAQAAEMERDERRVMVEWEATEPDHLDVMRGAFIHVHERRDDGMAFCRTFDGTKMGWFPYALTGHVIFGYKTEGLNDPASSFQPKEVYPPWDGPYLHITHPELATKDEFDDMSDSDDEQKPAYIAPAPAAAAAAAATAAATRAETDRRVQDIESQMAELKAKIKAATAAKKAKAAAAAEAAKKAAPTATPQAAPSASLSCAAETGVETPSGADGEGIGGPAEGAGREAEVGGGEEEVKEVKGVEPTSAFDKSRRTPWECGEEDFVDWDDDEL